MCTNQGFKSFIPIPNLLDSNFLYYWLKTNKEYLQNLGVGATFKEISKATIENVEIPLPSLEEQRRIAEILDKADALIQNRKKAIEKLDELLQATFIDMFGDPVTNPKGWDVKSLGHLVRFKGGGTPSRHIDSYWNGNIYWVSVKDFKELNIISSSTESITPEGVANSATNIIPKDTLIMPTRMGLGKVAITGCDLAINQDIKALFIKDIKQILTQYLLSFLILIKGQIISLGKGATVKGVTLEELSNLKINIPPINLQIQWSKFIKSIEEQKQQMQEQLEVQETLFKSLQQQAFSGQL